METTTRTSSFNRRGRTLSLIFAILITMGVPAVALGADGQAGAVTLGAAFLGGLLAALTPCVYPVIPLAVGTMGAWGKIGRGRAAFLSGAYVLGMVAVYSTLGVAAGLSGSLFGGWAGSPVFKIGAASLMWVLGAGLLGVYAFRLPPRVTQWAATIGGAGPAGALLSGAVSGILAAGCVGPVLGGILTYVGVSQDVGSAAAIMTAFSLGMGVPFFLLGTVLPSLPRPGGWLVWVEAALGVALIGTGGYFMAGVLSTMGIDAGPIALAAGVIVALAAVGTWIWAASTHRVPGRRTLAGTLVVVMALGLTSTALGRLSPAERPEHAVAWSTVRSDDELARALARRTAGKPVVVDFHADWCADCRVVERTVLSDEEVARRLGESFTTIRVDATDGTDPLLPIAKRYGVPGVPAVRFFGADGVEIEDLRINGPFDKERLMRHLSRAEGGRPGEGERVGFA